MPQAQSKTERIDVRVTTETKETLQRAAAQARKSVSEFLLDAGIVAAAETLADRRSFILDEVRWRAFQEALDRPASDKPRLAKLLSGPSPFE